MPKALFIDRDGVLNEILMKNGVISSPCNWEEIKIYPEMKRLPEIKKLGYLLIMMTNQPDIERGIAPKAFVDEVHAKFRMDFGLDAIFCCPFDSNEHPDKKPNPGMFLKAAREFNLDMSRSFHVGDTIRDVEAAKNAGCRSILYSRPYNLDLKPDFRIKTFDELLEILVS